MNIKDLLDLTCQTVANMIKGATHCLVAIFPKRRTVADHPLVTQPTGKTPEEIRKTFNITNDFSPEEEEEVRAQCMSALHTPGWLTPPASGWNQVRRENQWAFE